MNTHTQRNDFAKDYIDVATRIAEFRSKYPNGSLRPVNPEEPVKIIQIGDKTYLQYVAAAYRSPDDPMPGIGTAWELFPGRTPFTRDSEAMVAETSAWGRAIVAALAADTKHGVASLDEIQAARARKTETVTVPAKRSAIRQAMESNDSGEPIIVAHDNAGGITDAQVRKIAVLRKELALDDEVYHQRLTEMFAVSSTKSLSKEQARNLIDKLEVAKSKRSVA